MDIDNRI